MRKSLVLWKNLNVRTGLVFELIAALVAFGVRDLKQQAKLLPMLLVYCMCAFGIILVVQEILRIGRVSDGWTVESEKVRPKLDARVITDYAVTFFAMFVSFLLIKVLGFYTSIGLFVAFVYLFYMKSRSKRDILVSIVFALILMVTLYLLFKGFMRLRTPTGLII